MFLNIVFIILLYTFTLVILLLSNIFYLMPEIVADIAQNKAIFIFLLMLYVLFFYLLYVLIHGIYTKKLHKNYIYAYIGFWILLIIYYFGYYTQLDNKDIVFESEFVTKLQDVDVIDDNNGLIQMDKLLKGKGELLLSIEDMFFNNKYYCIVEGKGKKCEDVKLELVLDNYSGNYSGINIFNEEMKKAIGFEYFKQRTDVDNFVSLQGLSQLTRMSLFTSIYELNNGNEDKAVDTLLIYKRLGDKLLNGDNSLVGMIVGITIVSMSSNNINYILDNYSLDNSSLDLLKNGLNTTYNSKEIFANTIKMEYWTNKHSIEKSIGEGKMKTSMIFDIDEYLNEQRKAWLNVINGEESYYKTIPVNYFKRSFIYRFLGGVERFSSTGYIEDLENLNNERKKLLEKIELKLGE